MWARESSVWLMGLGRINDNSIHIGLGGDFPSKEVKYFINIISFIPLNFLWCGIYYSQLPDGQLTAEKCLIFPKAHEDRVSVCVGKWALIDWVATHSFARSQSHSRPGGEPIMCQALTQDAGGAGDKWSILTPWGKETGAGKHNMTWKGDKCSHNRAYIVWYTIKYQEGEDEKMCLCL